MGKKPEKKPPTTMSKKAMGAPPALPYPWLELFCRESDIPAISGAISLLQSTYPPPTGAPPSKGRYGNLALPKLLRKMVPRYISTSTEPLFGNYIAGTRVFWRGDMCVFFFLRTLGAPLAHCMTVALSRLPRT